MTTSYAKPIPVAQPVFASAREHALEVERCLTEGKMLRATHDEVEAFVNEQGQEWARRMLQAQVLLRAEKEARVEVVGADGIERGSVRESERHVETIIGRIVTPRLAYQQAGCVDLHPMDAALNLPPDLYSYGIRRMVAKEVARASFEEVVESVDDYSGGHIAKRQVEELAVRAARDFDEFYEQRERQPDVTEDLLVISTDGKGIVVRHEDLRDATRLAAEKDKHKLETRLSPGEKPNRKRMAQVATVYTVPAWERSAADVLHTLRDEDTESKRPPVRDKRVWASVEKHQRKVIRAAFEEALRRDPEQRRRWVVLVDGENKQLRAVKAEARRAGVTVTILVDIIHVLEYIWKAARALFGESSPEAESWVGHRLLALLSGHSGGDIARTIRWWAQRQDSTLDAAARKTIAGACGYLANRTRTRLMRYADALRDGLPIATGVVEGACRYVVKDRMDRTGARWSLAGAEAVLRLRALRASADFDEYWHFHLAREHQRNHAASYANADIPDPLPERKRNLRRIK